MGPPSMSETDIKISIKNYIQNSITQDVKASSTLISSSIGDISTSVLEQNITTMKTDFDCTNMMKISSIKTTPDSHNNVLKISQNCIGNQSFMATAQLAQKTDSIETIVNKINDDVLAKIDSNAQIKETLRNALDLNSALKQTSGGLGGLVDSVFPFVQPLIQNSQLTDTNVSQDIVNSIKNDLHMSTTTDQDIKTYVQNTIKSTITQQNIQSCLCGGGTVNSIDISDGITIGGHDNIIDLSENSTVNQTVTCLIETGQEAQVNNGGGNVVKLSDLQDATNKATTDSSILDSIKTSVTTTISGGAGSMGGISCCCCCCLIIIAIIMMVMGGGTPSMPGADSS
jgi:hypothetical protein